MARTLFGGSSDDYAVDTNGRPLPNRRIRFYTSAAMTTEITDIASDLAGTGTPLTVSTNGYGFWGPVYLPDGTDGSDAHPVYAGAADGAGNPPKLVVRIYSHTATSGGVSTFMTRTGDITLLKADVTSTGLAAADVGADATGAAATVQTNLTAEVTRAQAAEAALGGGMQFRTAVVVATTNQASLSGLPTVDGVTLTAGQVILLTAQSTGSQNGLWAVAVGAWARPSNFAVGFNATATSVLVESGTAGAGTTYAVTGTTNNVVGTNVLTFVKTSGGAASLAVKDEGTTVLATPSALNFVGAGVTASDGGSGVATVTIPGGGGSSTFPVTTIAASGTAQTLTVPAHAEAGYDITLTGNCTLTISGGTASEECILVLYLKQDATGSRTVAWPAAVKWPNNVVPTLSTAAGAVDIILLRTKDASTTLYGSVLASAGISSTILAAKGDLITATGAGAATNLPVGANGQTLVADSTQAAGVKWATAAAVSGIRPMLASTWYNPAGAVGGVANKALSATAGTPWAIPIWLPACTLTGLACYVSTASTYATFDARLGIYDGSTGIPGSLVVDAGTFSCLTTGAKTLTISTPVTAGLYWLVIAGQNLSTPGAVPQFKAISNVFSEVSIGTAASNLQFGGGTAYNGGAMTGALSATFPYITGAYDSAAPMILVKA